MRAARGKSLREFSTLRFHPVYGGAVGTGCDAMGLPARAVGWMAEAIHAGAVPDLHEAYPCTLRVGNRFASFPPYV